MHLLYILKPILRVFKCLYKIVNKVSYVYAKAVSFYSSPLVEFSYWVTDFMLPFPKYFVLVKLQETEIFPLVPYCDSTLCSLCPEPPPPLSESPPSFYIPPSTPRLSTAADKYLIVMTRCWYGGRAAPLGSRSVPLARRLPSFTSHSCVPFRWASSKERQCFIFRLAVARRNPHSSDLRLCQK